MSINSRIEQIIDSKGLNKNSFSVKTGILPQTLHHIVGGRLTKPSYDVIRKILQSFPDINARWLILGEENGYYINKNEYCNTSDSGGNEDRQRVVQVHFDRFNEFIRKFNDPQFIESLPGVSMPIVGRKLKHTFNFQICSEDMIPSIQPFDWIGAKMLTGDFKEDLLIGQIYVIVTETQLLVRRLRSIGERELYWGSDNPAYTVSKMSISDIRAMYLGEYLYSQNLNPKLSMASLLQQIAAANTVHHTEQELENEFIF